MIMQPKYVTAEDVNLAVEQVKKKKNLLALSKVRFLKFQRRLCCTNNVCWSVFSRRTNNNQNTRATSKAADTH